MPSEDGPWWDALSDLELLAELRRVGVQDVVARNLVSRRSIEGARYRMDIELGPVRTT
jgi:hypothetical protein